jgi:hypothetical protein
MRLELGDLKVESFVAGRGEPREGTVRGHDSTTDCTVTESGDAYCAENTQFCPMTGYCSHPEQNTCWDGCAITNYGPRDTCDHSTCGMTACGGPSCDITACNGPNC